MVKVFATRATPCHAQSAHVMPQLLHQHGVFPSHRRGLFVRPPPVRYINDCRNASLYNVAFQKLPQERKALVVALKNIEKGQEVFVDYGR